MQHKIQIHEGTTMKTTRAMFACGFALMCLAMLLISDSEAVAQPGINRAADALRARAMPSNIGDGFTISGVGDLIIQHPETIRDDPGFQSLVKILKGSDVSFGNMEGVIGDPRDIRGYPEGKPEGSYFLFDPAVAADLKAMGITMVGRANNHTWDWGIEGMNSTDHLLDLAGVVHAGTGMSQGVAREAAYQETPKGRVGLIAMASATSMGSHMPSGVWDEGVAIAASAPPVGAAPGRPGLNALRITPYVLVNAASMESLRAIRATMPNAGGGGGGGGQNSNQLSLFGVGYRVSDHTGYTYVPDPSDLEYILANIREAKEDSNFVAVSIHCHQPGDWSTEPADFLITLAHAAIDNGADIFFSHGPHQMRGIEIYKGKPIFYSLGNFFFEESMITPVPQDVWDQTRLDPKKMTDAELQGGRFASRGVEEYQAVIATTKYEHGQASEIRLTPIFLGGPTQRDADRGVPHLAEGDMAQEILKHMQDLSKPYGTVIEIQQNIGIIHVPPVSADSPGVAQ
jgi:poly-gamma-glutamate capsule biosynthesis protein CapA/YwtB (metallophosphatase superfamily)